jgi:hypothetical protein
MPPITAAVGDLYQVRVMGRQEGQQTQNVLHFLAATAIDDVELRLIAALAECFVTHLIPQLSSAWALEKIAWKKVAPTLGVDHETVPEGTLVGGGSASVLPSFATAVVSERTLTGGRSHRGRFSLAGIPEPATTGSQFDTSHAFWAALVAFVACVGTKFILGDPPAANSFSLQVYSRKLGGSAFPYTTPGLTEVESLVLSQLVGTIRSRKVGRGA